MQPFAGVIVVWSGSELRHETVRIGDGLVFGREHADASDDRISRAHARLVIDGDDVVVEDLSSRNGTYLDEHRIITGSARARLPAILRTGRTVAVIVGDIRQYEHVPLSRRGSVVVGGSLDRACRALDVAAIDEDNVAVLGTMSIGRALADSYAEKIGGPTHVVELGPLSRTVFEHEIAGATPRTIILVLARPLTLPDVPELSQWLETDVRIVSVARGLESFKFVLDDVTRRLMARTVELPALRLDELPMTMHDRILARVPGVQLHASLVAAVLTRARSSNEEQLLAALDQFVDDHRDRAVLRGDDFTEFMQVDYAIHNNHALVGVPRRRRD